MSLLLPQERAGTIQAVRPVDIHGDRYVDLSIALDDPSTDNAPPTTGRVAANECPADLQPGDRVSARFVMGVMVRVARAGSAGG